MCIHYIRYKGQKAQTSLYVDTHTQLFLLMHITIARLSYQLFFIPISLSTFAEKFFEIMEPHLRTRELQSWKHKP